MTMVSTEDDLFGGYALPKPRAKTEPLELPHTAMASVDYDGLVNDVLCESFSEHTPHAPSSARIDGKPTEFFDDDAALDALLHEPSDELATAPLRIEASIVAVDDHDLLGPLEPFLNRDEQHSPFFSPRDDLHHCFGYTVDPEDHFFAVTPPPIEQDYPQPRLLEHQQHITKPSRKEARGARQKRPLDADGEQTQKKKNSRKNGCLSEIRWAQERAASSDETMPLKRPVGISLASGSSSGWRLRISGTQLGHYATAEQAWKAYPRTAERRATLTQQHHQRTAAAAEDMRKRAADAAALAA